MNKFIKSKEGLTLIELIVVIGVVIMFCGFIIVSVTVVPQTRMKNFAETFKSNFTLTKDFAKTHGGQAKLEIVKTGDGVALVRSGQNIKKETILLEDNKLQVYYNLTEVPDKTYTLGVEDPDSCQKVSLDNSNSAVYPALVINFAQTTGDIIGPDMVDSITLSNGNKNYKFYIKRLGGMIYYDFDVPEGVSVDNSSPIADLISVAAPVFILNDTTVSNAHYECEQKLDENGNAIATQPNIQYDARYIKIGGVYRAIEIGEYKIEFKLKDPFSSKWEDGTTDIKYLTWEIK